MSAGLGQGAEPPQPPPGRVGMTARTVLMVVINAAVVIALFEGFCRVLPNNQAGGSILLAAGLSALVSVPILYFLARHVLHRGVREAILAVSDGLTSLAERDYTLRLAVERDDEVGLLLHRFNVLTEVLRSEHNDVYQREMMLETVLGATSMGAVISDAGGRVVFSNVAARRFFGDGRKLEGQNLDEILAAAPADVRVAAAAPGDILFTCDRPGHEPETFHLTKRHFEISLRRHTLWLLRPLTKELARKEVETWKKAIRVLSHEMNNSLAPIASLVQSARLMLQNPAHAERLEGALDTIDERAAHLRAFLDSYASFARLPQPSRREIAWRDLLAGVEGLYPFRVAGALPERPAFVDPGQVQQVLINLLKNAVESGSPAGDIVIDVAPADGAGVGFSVLDRGRGMSAEVMRNALLPFYSTKRTGTGLGLSLCREIVDAHGGRLSLHPRDPGGGVAVRCWLPHGPSVSAAAAASSSSSEPAAAAAPVPADAGQR